MAHDTSTILRSPPAGEYANGVDLTFATCLAAGSSGRSGKAMQGGCLYRVHLQAQLLCIAAFLLLVTIAPVNAGESLRVGFQSTGTFAWVLDVIRRHALAERAGLDLQVSGFASPDAGKIA